MLFPEWVLSTVSSAALLSGAAFLARNVIVTRLTKAVQHEFDVKTKAVEHEFNSRIAEVSSSHRKSEEAFKSELMRKESEISALQAGILGGRAARLAAVDKRRLEAVDQIWEAVRGLQYLQPVAAMVSVIKVGALAKEIARNPKAGLLLEHLDLDIDKANEATKLAHRARPYISEIAWAYFLAFSTILYTSATTARMVKGGLDLPDLFNQDAVKSLIVAALPHAADYIEKFGITAGYNLLEQLMNLLLAELRRTMDGAEAELSEYPEGARDHGGRNQAFRRRG